MTKVDPNELKLSGLQFSFYEVRKLDLVISTAHAQHSFCMSYESIFPIL